VVALQVQHTIETYATKIMELFCGVCCYDLLLLPRNQKLTSEWQKLDLG
jgi:hypothetical protein